MRRLLCMFTLFLVIGITLGAQVGNFSKLVLAVDARTIASNGGGTAATLTLTPLGSYVAITCNDTDGCDITMGETGIQDGMPITVVNMSSNAVTFSDTAGVSELTGAASLGQYATLTLIYRSDRWVEVSRSSGSGSGTVTTTGSPASGNLAFFSGASSITNGNLSGEVTTSGTGATTITNNAVTNARLRDSGALSVIGRSANSSGDPADISASAASDAVLRESGSTVGFGTIATAGIADDAVTYAKIQNVSAASRVLCRGTASGAGNIEECTLGAGMSQAGTVISSVVTGSNGGDVVGPSSATDNAVARFDSTTGKLIQDTSTLTLSDAGAFTFADGVKQTFNPDATNAGINVGSVAGDPSSPANGDLWYDSTANTLDARINGATVQLGAGSGGVTWIEEQTPTGTSVTFSSLGSYTHLKIVYSARGDQTATATAVNLTFNGDTGSNYDREALNGTGGSATAGESIGQTSVDSAVIISAASATSGLVGSGEILISDYRGTTFHKAGTATYTHKTSNASGGTTVRVTGFGWRSTSAITSITLTLASGNFVSGSKFTLYGLQ